MHPYRRLQNSQIKILNAKKLQQCEFSDQKYFVNLFLHRRLNATYSSDFNLIFLQKASVERLI